MRRFMPAVVAVALVLTLLPSGAQPTVVKEQEIALDGLAPGVVGDGDVRAEHLRGPAATPLRAASALAKQVKDLRITWNARLGTAKHIFSDGGTLTKPAGIVGSGIAERIARDWITAHRDLFGLSLVAARKLRTTRNGALPDGGAHALVFRVFYGQIPTFGGGTIGVNLARDGRIASVWADTGPTGTLNATPRISAAAALQAVVRREGVTSLRIQSLGQRTSGDRLAIFAAGGGYAPHNVRLVAFPTAGGPRLAWRVFYAKAAEEMLSTAVDAATGVVLMRHNQVQHAEGDKGTVFRNHPGAPKGGRYESVSFEGDPAWSPRGWVGQAPTTAGNNVVAFTDWTWPKLAANGQAPALALSQFNPVPDTMPVAPDRNFDFPFTNEWSKACTPLGTEDTGELAENPSYIEDREASVTNIFYFGNVIHDFSYRYGFTEAFGNMQTDNFDKPNGREQDAIRFMAQAGILNGQLDNAFMFTPADGGEPTQFADPSNPTFAVNYIPPFSGMFLWRPVPSFQAPCVDGDQDASTAYHEYTHGISNRMTGGGDEADGLNAHQSGSMGEAWSDWVAHIILDSQNIEDRAADGIYITGNQETGIRHFRLDQNPLTYGDMGFGRFGPEVHDDGEIWSGTLWDLRDAFVKKYGKRSGLDRVTHLVFDGMATQPRTPDFLDARDAILASDKVRYRNADASLIWSVFARRGMGRGARSRDASDVNPRPGFDAVAGNGTLVGSIEDAGGKPIIAKVLIGLGEGKPTPVATSSRSGSFRIPMAAGTYPISIAAAGYGIQKIGAVTIRPGSSTIKDITLQRNVASVGWGAVITGGLAAGDPGVALIDDHEFTGQPVTVGKPVTIRLAGSAPATVRAVAVSAKPASGGTGQNATRYSVHLSADGRSWKTVLTGGVKRYKPRPSALQWVRPTKSAGGMKARYARITVHETFGGGKTAILSGIQVLGVAPGMKVAPVGGDKPVVDPDGAITLANAGGPDASITFNEFAASCSKPATQGLDLYVSALPANAGDGVHLFQTKGGNEVARDLDIYFYDADCQPTGDIASGSADESGPIPPGSAWAVVVLYAGTTNGFTITVTTTLERVIPPAGIATARPGAGGGSGGGRVIERDYVNGIGDVGNLNCADEVQEVPAIGAVCFLVKPGERVQVEVSDDLTGNPSGSYAFHSDNPDPLAVDMDVVPFCGDFVVKIPAGVGELAIYLDTALSVASDCEGEPATTGVVTAHIN